ncbi:MAG: single-stranded DNA-binding protein [Pusillimonas sp.]
MNKITITGRLAADAELRYSPSGDAICGFRVASDIGYGERKSTNWFSCQVWGKRGEALAPHLTKGQQVTVFGSLTLREWNDKEGSKRLSPDVRVDEIELQGGKRDDSQPAQQRQQPRPAALQAASVADLDDDLIPF